MEEGDAHKELLEEGFLHMHAEKTRLEEAHAETEARAAEFEEGFLHMHAEKETLEQRLTVANAELARERAAHDALREMLGAAAQQAQRSMDTLEMLATLTLSALALATKPSKCDKTTTASDVVVGHDLFDTTGVDFSETAGGYSVEIVLPKKDARPKPLRVQLKRVSASSE